MSDEPKVKVGDRVVYVSRTGVRHFDAKVTGIPENPGHRYSGLPTISLAFKHPNGKICRRERVLPFKKGNVTTNAYITFVEILSARSPNVNSDGARLDKLDRLLSDDTGFRVSLRWDNENDVVTIVDGFGNVWGSAQCDDSPEMDLEGRTLRAALDTVGRKPLRKIPVAESLLDELTLAGRALMKLQDSGYLLRLPDNAEELTAFRAALDKAEKTIT